MSILRSSEGALTASSDFSPIRNRGSTRELMPKANNGLVGALSYSTSSGGLGARSWVCSPSSPEEITGKGVRICVR